MTKQTYSIVATNYCGPKAARTLANLKPGDAVWLVREPENTVDKNAVAIYAGPQKIGYVPKAKNAVLSAFLDQQETKIIQMAMDDGMIHRFDRKAIDAVFKPSPNSGFPQVEVG